MTAIAGSWRRIATFLGCLLLLQAGPFSGEAIAMYPGAISTWVDLAALSLSPADLDRIDRTGYAHDAANIKLLLDQVVDLAGACGVTGAVSSSPVAQAIEDRLEAVGWQWQYVDRDGLPNPADSSRFGRIVTTAVTQYVDANAAQNGFDYLEDEAGNCFGTGEDLPGLTTIGEASEMTRIAGSDPGVQTLVLSIRQEAFVISVALTDAVGEAPEVATVEGLGRQLLEQIRTAEERERIPSLGALALRLDTPSIQPGVRLYGVVPGMRLAGGTEEGFLRVNGRDVPQVGETAGVYAARQRAFAEATDVYQVRQVLGTDATAPVYRVVLAHFPDAQLASGWFPGVQAFAEIEGLRGVAAVPNAPSFGDESLVLAFELTSGERTSAGYLVSARVGADVVVLILLGEEAPRLETVEQLMRAQLECLSAGECPERHLVPREMKQSNRILAGRLKADRNVELEGGSK